MQKIITSLKNVSSEELSDLREKLQEVKASMQNVQDKARELSSVQLDLIKSIKSAEFDAFSQYLKENLKKLQTLQGKVFQKSCYAKEYILINSITVSKKTLLIINYQSIEVGDNYLNFNNRILKTIYPYEIINFFESLTEIVISEWFSSFITLSNLIIQNNAK